MRSAPIQINATKPTTVCSRNTLGKSLALLFADNLYPRFESRGLHFKHLDIFRYRFKLLQYNGINLWIPIISIHKACPVSEENISIFESMKEISLMSPCTWNWCARFENDLEATDGIIKSSYGGTKNKRSHKETNCDCCITVSWYRASENETKRKTCVKWGLCEFICYSVWVQSEAHERNGTEIKREIRTN